MNLAALATAAAMMWIPTVQAGSAENDMHPNVILVMTDDQGYGDFASTGNPWIKTPNLDLLRTQGTWLDNFHVDPTCAPTRGALLTGRYSGRVGVWHTIQGRNMLRRREVTMADVFAANGYATGMFGKWHLGDNYPYRPQDRGFHHVVYHGGGGVGQTPDYWGNDYFDDTYIVNGVHQRFSGYCTDVWFAEAAKFIRSNKDRPFLVYLPTNAPHGPLHCPEEYEAMYAGNPDVPSTAFYGMISNIDDNMGRLMSLLKEEGLEENTILIFTTDNGTAGGLKQGKGFDGDMRGKKSSQYEGGHRVPLMIRWPRGGIEAGKSIDRLTAHVDVLPTLIDLCGLQASDIAFDGASIRPLLDGDDYSWADRVLVVESQRIVQPRKWRRCAVMTDQWRLVDGKELYDIRADPLQAADVAEQHPDVVDRLRGEYEAFWPGVAADHEITSHIVVGADGANPVILTSHDWLVEGVPWNQPHIRSGKNAKPAHWAIEVERNGEYEISLRRWPVEADAPITSGAYGEAFPFTRARLKIADIDRTIDIPDGATEVTFSARLSKGVTRLAPTFIRDNGEEATPYYVYVRYEPAPGWQTPEGMGIPRVDPGMSEMPAGPDRRSGPAK